MSKAVLPDFGGPERTGFDLGDGGLSCLVEMERLVWGSVSEVPVAGWQEWTGGEGDEAGERSTRLQSYCCELLSREGRMLEVSLGLEIQWALILQ